MLGTGELSPIRRGCYLRGALPDDRERRHVLRARATSAELTGDAVLSHVSAALLHGLVRWGIPLGLVHVTRPGRTGGRRGTRLHVHTAPLRDDDVVDVGGVPVTSVARTVADLARTVAFEPAVVVADSALFSEYAERSQLESALEPMARWPGAPAARRALAFASGLADGPGESRSRVAMARIGVPAPRLQYEVCSEQGEWVATVDFAWPERRTVAEFDGEVKYGRLLRSGQRSGEVVFAEKQREDAIRDQRWGVVRWCWDDIPDFAAVATRLQRSFTRAT